ncbi:MAG: zf-HC2 domain-containing protein [Oleiphilaceae bacterium]|nr:zf-HC2 domain-containing protein [Oleiphilaceae bacterium]
MMRCDTDTLDDYLDGALSEAHAVALEAHLRECGRCRRHLSLERQWRANLSRLGAPSLSSEAAEQLLASAHARHQQSVSHSGSWLGVAVAASLALGLALGVYWPGSPQPGGEEMAAENGMEALRPLDERVRTMRLAFNAEKPLQGVTLTLELPPHAELERYPGQQQLSWVVDLDAGENVLALPMRVLYPDDGEVVARLSHGDQQATFTAPVPGAATESESDSNQDNGNAL